MAGAQRLTPVAADRGGAAVDAEAPRRLFIGLFPDAAVRAAIVAHRERWRWPPKCRLTPPQQLHLTLHFLGDVSAPTASALQRALAEVELPPLVLVLRHGEVWRNGVAALRPDESAALRDWQATLVPALRRAGLPAPEPEWTPHLTLARRAAGATPPNLPCRIRWAPTGIALVWSRALRGGGYERLASYPSRAGVAR